VDNDLENSYKSDIWWFKTNLNDSKMEIIYKLNISGPKFISIKQGGNKSISLNISNLGSSEDIVELNLQSGNLSEYVALNDHSLLKIASHGYKYRDLQIILPDNVKPGIYKIKILAFSKNSDEKVKASHNITIEVTKLKKENGSGGGQNAIVPTYIFILALIIIISIIIITIFLNNKRHKKRLEKKLHSSETVTKKPSAFQVFGLERTSSTTLTSQQSIQDIPKIIQTTQMPKLPPPKGFREKQEPEETKINNSDS